MRDRSTTFITGVGSGLGEELALLGMTFSDVYGTVTETQHRTNQFPLQKDRVFLLDADLDPCLSQEVVDTLPDIDQLILNAGINDIRPFEQVTLGFLERLMRVNAFSPVLLVQQLMAAGKLCNATVCFVVSDAAHRPMRHSLAYNMSKAAVDIAVKQLARELTKPNELRIFGVRPGKMAATEMSAYIDRRVCDVRGWTPEQAERYFKDTTVEGRATLPGDMAQLIWDLINSDVPLSGACLDLVG